MRVPVGFILILALVAPANAIVFGRECRTAKDCRKGQECMPHDFVGEELRTCEYACDPFRKEPACPRGRACVMIGGDGPDSSLGGICVRNADAPPKPPPPTKSAD